VTFRVDRVWKGDVYRDMVIHQLIEWAMYPPGTRQPLPFDVEKEYFVSTHRLPAWLVASIPMDQRDPERFKADGLFRGSSRACSTWSTDFIAVEKVLGGAPGEPPLERR
jgi:hypothetical protein